MRFLEDGPDIPDDLIDIVTQGRAVFVCGAGVSKRAGLPLFKDLVKQVYEELGEPFDNGPEELAERKAFEERAYDRVLHLLEKRTYSPRQFTSAVRQAVARSLQPTGTPLADHLALLTISRNEADVPRLITTNFDTLFERAWLAANDDPLASTAGAALPGPGKPRDKGVLHLHGRIADPDIQLEDTDLVLTSADFGDAYLRAGWASRHIDERLRLNDLILVGYQADDAAMRLLLDALDADRNRFPDLKRVYAFSRQEITEEAVWESKGAIPIMYASSGPSDHDRLYTSLAEWAKYSDAPEEYSKARLKKVLMKEAGDATELEKEQVVFLLPRFGGDGLLTESNPPFSWAGILQDAGLISGEIP